MAIQLLDFTVDPGKLKYDAYHCLDLFTDSPETEVSI